MENNNNKNIDELLSKKSTRATAEKKNTNADLKAKMQSVINASKKLEDDMLENDKNEELKAKLAKASRETAEMYDESEDEEFEDKDEEMSLDEYASNNDAMKDKMASLREKLAQARRKQAEEDLYGVQEETSEENKENIFEEVIEEPKEVVEENVAKEVIEEQPKEVVEENVAKEVIEEQLKEVVEENISKELIEEQPKEIVQEVIDEKSEIIEEDKSNEEIKFEEEDEEAHQIVMNLKDAFGDKKHEEKKEEPISILEEEKEELNLVEVPIKKENKVLSFFRKTSSGFAYGILFTYAIAYLIRIICNIPFIENNSTAYNVLIAIGIILEAICPVAIGAGIAFKLGFNDVKGITLAIVGGISAYLFSSEMFKYSDFGFQIISVFFTYLIVSIDAALLMIIFDKETKYDTLFVPLFGIIMGILFTLLASPYIYNLEELISIKLVNLSDINPILTSFIFVLLGVIFATTPFAPYFFICIELDFASTQYANIAIASMVLGACSQMIGLGVQSFKDNGIAKTLGVCFGTSKLQFSNIIKKPIIWIPSVISALLLAVVAIFVTPSFYSAYAGEGSVGFACYYYTFAEMKENIPMMLLAILGLELIIPAILTFVFDLIFRKLGLIKDGDFKIE